MADLPRSFTLVQRKGVSGYQKLKGLLDKGNQKDRLMICARNVAFLAGPSKKTLKQESSTPNLGLDQSLEPQHSLPLQTY